MGQRHVETDPDNTDLKQPGKSRREYEHSSGDRNTRKREKDWKGFRGGTQRDATPGAPGQPPAKDADRR